MSTTITTQTPAVQQTDTVATISRLSVSVLSLVVFMAALGVAYWTKNETAMNLMVGAVISNATTVVNFWLGSSQSSSGKDAALAQITTPPVTTTRTTQ